MYSDSSSQLITWKGNGISILISNFKEIPSVEEEINLEPGVLANVMIRKELAHCLPKPYSDCTYFSNYRSILFDEIARRNGTYRYSDCLILCLQKQNAEICKCYDLFFAPYPDTKPCLNT